MGILRISLLAFSALLFTGCAWLIRDNGVDEHRFDKYPQPQRDHWLVVRRRCTNCHDIDRVFNSMWMMDHRRDVEVLVDEMADREGSSISAQDRPHIVDFLDYYRLHGHEPK